jgi:hypothetical protein
VYFALFVIVYPFSPSGQSDTEVSLVLAKVENLACVPLEVPVKVVVGATVEGSDDVVNDGVRCAVVTIVSTKDVVVTILVAVPDIVGEVTKPGLEVNVDIIVGVSVVVV